MSDAENTKSHTRIPAYKTYGPMPKIAPLIGLWSFRMQTPLRLTFRHVDRSPAVEAHARSLLDRLQRFNSHIAQIHMTIEGPPGERRHGAPYTVKIDFTVPGAQIHAENLERNGADHSDIYLAISDAFDNAKRQLLNIHRQRRELASGA